MIKVGDLVRLIEVPPLVEARPDRDDMHTKDVFRQCVGHVFRVRGVGTNSPWGETDHLELWVRRGTDCDDVAAADTVWVEPGYVDVVASPDP